MKIFGLNLGALNMRVFIKIFKYHNIFKTFYFIEKKKRE